jgi:phosphoinositide-3-kinase regulatory subunit 4
MRDYVLKLANATSRYVRFTCESRDTKYLHYSFASRLNHEPEVGKNLKLIGDVELQKLGVVPVTVFLKHRSSDSTPRSSRIHTSRRSTYDSVASRTPIYSSMNRISSATDHSSASTGMGSPFEDLRRRLATINGSASSIAASQPQPPRSANTNALSPAAASTSSSRRDSISGLLIPLTSTLDRPGSPTESVLSTANSATFRPLSMLQVGGDGQKAAPAVGSSKTNATGLLEAHSKLRSAEDSPDISGRSSPMSMSATLRGSQRQRIPSILPISTYGVYICSITVC